MLRNIRFVPQTRLAGALMVGCTVAALAACGAGDGKHSRLPQGPPTNAGPGDLVLYVAMAQGDRVDAYRLGTDGLLPRDPFDTIVLTNPRRLAIGDGVLHVATEDRVVSLALDENGEMPSEPTSQSQVIRNFEPNEILLRNNVLYVAATGVQRVYSYELDGDGLVPFAPDGIGQGEFTSDYVSLAISGDYLYSGARRSAIIDTFLLDEDGHVPPRAEAVDPLDRISLPDDIEIRDGILYVTSGSDRSIRSYRIRANGTLPDEDDARTNDEEFYQTILLNGDLLYAAAYNAGRIDTYEVATNGLMVEAGPIYGTAPDPSSYPNQMLLHGGILYVAQAGLDRVDAYVLGPNGEPPRFATSSTDPFPGNSFPADLAMFALD